MEQASAMNSLRFCLLLVFSFPVLASQIGLQIEDLNISYKKPSGKGSVTLVNYAGATLSGNLQAEMTHDVETNRYRIHVAGFQIPYLDQLGTFEQVKQGEMERLNLFHGDNRLNLSFQKFYGIESKGSLLMSGFQLGCYQTVSLIEGSWQDILEGCLKQGRLTLEQLNSASSGQKTLNSFATDLSGRNSLQQQTQGVGVSKLRLAVKETKLNFSLKLPLQLGQKGNVSVKGSGKIALDRTNNVLIIKIATVKVADLLTVTPLFFKAMNGVGGGRVSVEPPYIRIKLTRE